MYSYIAGHQVLEDGHLLNVDIADALILTEFRLFLCNWTLFKAQTVIFLKRTGRNHRRIPFDQNFWFEFLKFSCVEWNGIFHQAGPILFNSHLSTFPTKNYLKKCWWIMMKVAVSNAVLSCFMCRRTRTQNSTLPWYLWEKLTNFSRGRVCKPGELTHRKFGTTSPQFSSDPNVFVFDQEQARTMADHFASSVVSTRKIAAIL